MYVYKYLKTAKLYFHSFNLFLILTQYKKIKIKKNQFNLNY